MKRLVGLVLGIVLAGSAFAGETLDLWVDPETKQLYSEPGPGRVKMGKFTLKHAEDTETDLEEIQREVEDKQRKIDEIHEQVTEQIRQTERNFEDMIQKIGIADKKVWYNRISIRGYTQFRYNQSLDGEDEIRAPGDRFIGRNQSFGVRRMRLVFSGQISDYLGLYIQPDFASSPSGSNTTHFAQLRDIYADIHFDKDKEFRVRAGQSKVPFGFENLQSSQNRLPLDRHEALNSAVRDERDIGAFFYYTPVHMQQVYKYLSDNNLKFSGNYGMLGFGLYNGQGANRLEGNDRPHLIVHATYPFQFMENQVLQIGADAYRGHFVSSTAEITLGEETFRPVLDSPDRGILDQRAAFHVVLFPQPIGLQAEWTWGEGPQLDVERQVIRKQSLDGGYVQAHYKINGDQNDFLLGALIPYVRWQKFNGLAKFDTNAPRFKLEEWEGGLEWQPVPELELVVAYAWMDRTNVSRAPYERVDSDMIRFQLQWNY